MIGLSNPDGAGGLTEGRGCTSSRGVLDET
jgi:hypothetical protein